MPFSIGSIPLEQDFVQPAVTEVVFVLETERLAGFREQLAQPDLRFVFHVQPEIQIVRARRAVPHAVDDELVQMAVFPAHRCLDDFVEITEGAVLRLDPPPNGRFDADKRHLELEDGVDQFRRSSSSRNSRIEQIADLSDDGDEPLLIRVGHIFGCGAEFVEHVVEFLYRELDDGDSFRFGLDSVSDLGPNSCSVDDRLTFRLGQLERTEVRLRWNQVFNDELPFRRR